MTGLPEFDDRPGARPPRRADLDAIFALHADPRTNRHNPDGPLRSRYFAERMLEDWLEDWRRQGVGYWAIESAPDGPLIGVAGIRTVSLGEGEGFNLYYRFTPAVWGRGLARRFATEAVALAHRDWPAIPVIARVRPANAASERVAHAAGLQPVGVDRAGRRVLADRPLGAAMGQLDP